MTITITMYCYRPDRGRNMAAWPGVLLVPQHLSEIILRGWQTQITKSNRWKKKKKRLNHLYNSEYPLVWSQVMWFCDSEVSPFLFPISHGFLGLQTIWTGDCIFNIAMLGSAGNNFIYSRYKYIIWWVPTLSYPQIPRVSRTQAAPQSLGPLAPLTPLAFSE